MQKAFISVIYKKILIAMINIYGVRSLNRRNFLKFAAVGVATLFTGCKSSLNPAEKILEIKFLRQIVTRDLSTARCIMWQSDEPLKNPAVEVSLANGEEITTFPAQESSFTDDAKKNFQYTAQIENLSPNKLYEYRVVDGDAATNWYELKRSFKYKKSTAIIFPDSQCAGKYDTWGGVACGAFERNPTANFFVNVGDLVDNGEDRAQWENWLARIERYLPLIPFAPVLGNHETYTREWTFRPPVSFLNYFATPDNGLKNFSRRFYSFDCGAAHFVVLDSQWDELEHFAPNLIETQKNWLREDLNATDKRWKIVFIHKDVLQYRINGKPNREEGFSDVGKIFMPEFENLGVDVVFSAHLHTYRNRGRIKNFQHDETGPLYILTGVSGNVRYGGLWIDHKLDKFVAPQPETNNYLTIEVEDKTLIVKCFLANGRLIDETTLNKI